MKLKRKKSLGPYIPARASADEKALRLCAAVIHDQMQLDTYLMRVAIGRKPDGSLWHPPDRQRGIQRGAYFAIRPYLKFNATMPAFIQEPVDPEPSAAVGAETSQEA